MKIITRSSLNITANGNFKATAAFKYEFLSPWEGKIHSKVAIIAITTSQPDAHGSSWLAHG